MIIQFKLVCNHVVLLKMGLIDSPSYEYMYSMREPVTIVFEFIKCAIMREIWRQLEI